MRVTTQLGRTRRASRPRRPCRTGGSLHDADLPHSGLRPERAFPPNNPGSVLELGDPGRPLRIPVRVLLVRRCARVYIYLRGSYYFYYYFNCIIVRSNFRLKINVWQIGKFSFHGPITCRNTCCFLLHSVDEIILSLQ